MSWSSRRGAPTFGLIASACCLVMIRSLGTAAVRVSARMMATSLIDLRSRSSRWAVRSGGTLGSMSCFATFPRFAKERSLVATAAAPAPTSAAPPAPAALKAGSVEALKTVRAELHQRGLHAFIVPSGDPHLSEYPAFHFWRRAFISGFDGSSGTAVITHDNALVWTDGRYYLQAEQQLGPEWILMKEGQKDVPSISTYLKDKLSSGARVGIDPTVHPTKFVTGLAKALKEKEISVSHLEVGGANPVDLAWGPSRPPAPQAPVRVHPFEYAGETIASKLDKLAAEMEKEQADSLICGMLDEVAWLLNVRGDDIPNCPLVVAYAVVERVAQEGGSSTGRAVIFIDDSKLGPEAWAHLQDSKVEVRLYADVFAYVRNVVAGGKRVWLDKDKTNFALLQAALGPSAMTENSEDDAGNKKNSVVSKPTPITMLKAIKNERELAGMREAHLRDGAAEVEFLAWLEKELDTRTVSELEIDEKLTAYRAKRPKFLGLSFDTIAGVGPNGAIIHYRATPGTSLMLDKTKMLLLDSGAQYEDGTTDVTRTVHFGEPSDFEKECFTRVLKGHIGIDTAVFPEGTPGFVLDVFARRSLWEHGLDYAHGTGHGVGAALNVHEGPQGISFNFANQTPLKAGMVLSNEPGFYLNGKFGIRTENLLVVVEKGSLGEGTDPRNRKFLGFARLTHIPFCRNLIKPGLLTPDEIRWVNQYHAEVWERVSPLVSSADAREWLRQATRPIV